MLTHERTIWRVSATIFGEYLDSIQCRSRWGYALEWADPYRMVRNLACCDLFMQFLEVEHREKGQPLLYMALLYLKSVSILSRLRLDCTLTSSG